MKFASRVVGKRPLAVFGGEITLPTLWETRSKHSQMQESMRFAVPRVDDPKAMSLQDVFEGVLETAYCVHYQDDTK